MEQWWNDTDRGKLKCWEKTLFLCHFFRHNSTWTSHHGNWLQTDNRSHGKASKIILNGEFLCYVTMYQLIILHSIERYMMV
jgi:hypothetical protein